MKRMTEREAWLYLARKWARTRKAHVTLRPADGGEACRGLCACACRLIHLGVVKRKVALGMLGRLHRRRPGKMADESYYWSLTIRGARARAAFCRRMAKEIANEDA